MTRNKWWLYVAVGLLIGGMIVAAYGCQDKEEPKPDGGPPVVSKPDFESFPALQECTWEIKLTWHHQAGYNVRAKYDTPNNPIGSKTAVADGQDLKLVLETLVQQIEADSGHR